MLVHVGHEILRLRSSASVACIGTFDGVHLGHQEVIGQTVQRARHLGRPAVLVTFDRHPAEVLAPDRVPPALATFDQNLEMFAELGVDLVLVLPFTPSLARMTAEDFRQEILQRTLACELVVVGHDFAFGHDREGNFEWLAERMPAVRILPFEVEGERVSSSEIRRRIQAGDIDRAARLLGRPYAVRGLVVHGQKLGRELGYPTANLLLPTEVAIPADGVYSGVAELGAHRWRMATSIGMRPTVEGKDRTVEAFLLDFDGDLYGRALTLHFERRLRPELRFGSLEELKAQMALDVLAARGA